MYNSAAGAKDHGVQRIQHKHDIERILSRRRSPSSVTSLRANIFGEELWKEYTRPDILKGRYPLPVNRWRKIYLTSVRDMGRLAGTIIGRNDDAKEQSNTTIRVLNVAGDHMTGQANQTIPVVLITHSTVLGARVPVISWANSG